VIIALLRKLGEDWLTSEKHLTSRDYFYYCGSIEKAQRQNA
jgi:hypothetical protein